MPAKPIRVTRAFPIAEDVAPNRAWGKGFSRDSGFTIRVVRNWVAVFVHSDLLSGDVDRVRAVLDAEGTIAYCKGSRDENWEVRSEPIGERKSGLSVYTAKGKAIISGILQLNDAGALECTFATLYPGITNSRRLDCTYRTVYKDGKWILEPVFH
jgi:hypothetical protein